MGFGSAFGTGMGFNIANKLTGGSPSKNYAKAEKERSKADIAMNKAKINAERESRRSQISADQRSEGLQAVMDISLQGDAAAIASSLANLISIISANSNVSDNDNGSDLLSYIGVGGNSNVAYNGQKDVCSAALQKLEMGIMLLRSKGDTATADYFQKKYTELDPYAEQKAYEKKLADQKSEGLQAIKDASFEGDATVITNSLTNLLSIANTNKSGGLLSKESDAVKAIKKEVYTAALAKIETGIMLLHSKGDATMVEFYEKKLMELEPKRKIMSMLQKKK